MQTGLRATLVFLVFIFLAGCSTQGTLVNTTQIDHTEQSTSTVITQNTNNHTTENTTNSQEQVTITFETFNGTKIPSQTIAKGDTIEYPSNPEKDGFLFVMWHTSPSLDAPFVATAPITSDVTLYAQWVEVSVDDVIISFVSEYGTPIASIVAQPGEPIAAPDDPTDLFYDFLGWVIQGTSTPFDFSLMPDESVTLEAVWEKNDTYEITFYLNDGEVYESSLFTSGEVMDLPTQPELEGFIFLGWYLSDTFDEAFVETSPMPTHNLSIYAKLVSVDDYFYTVSFESDGGTVIDSLIQVVGTAVSAPTDPVKKGYIFEGWYIDQDYTTLYDFDNPQSNNITLYAKWVFDETFSIIYLVVSEDETRTILLKDGEGYDLPRLFKDGYIFDWWYTAETYRVRYREYLYFPVGIDEPLTLYAKWVEAPNAVTIHFDANGGSDPYWAVKNSTYRYTGPLVANPGEEFSVGPSSRDGYTFRGWYLDPEFTQHIEASGYGNTTTFFFIPDQDTTYYAKWVSDTTGEVDDGSGTTVDVDASLMERLIDFGFVCEGTSCILEEYTNYNYVFDLETNILSYVVHVSQDTEEGYRSYDKIISVNPDYDIDYAFDLVENYGYEIHTVLDIEGNYLTDTYTVIRFDSNISSQEDVYQKAMDAIDYLIVIYDWVMG